METGTPRGGERVEILTKGECERLLASHDIGRLAFAPGGVPEILPVNYAADGSTVVFRTSPGSRLAQAVMRRVAFEVDEWDPVTRIAWSVVVHGLAVEITNALDPLATSLRENPVAPLAPGAHELWIGIYSSNTTGRRFRSPA